MIKKITKVTGIILLLGFSFFYTEKVTQIIKKKDPIMIKLNETKKDNYMQMIKPIIIDDEYIMGISGCEVDIEKSYNKMKRFGEYKDELIVMKEVENKNINDKYIISGNKLNKNVGIIILLNNNTNKELINYIQNKKIKINYFVDHQYLEDNTAAIKFISENSNIYYLGKDKKYYDEYMLYANNLIEINSNNKSNLCLLNEKDKDMLKLCSDYNMKTIKTDIITNNILSNIKEKLSNGAIITIDSDDVDQIKVALNYITSKGYNMVTLDKLLNQKKLCNN